MQDEYYIGLTALFFVGSYLYTHVYKRL